MSDATETVTARYLAEENALKLDHPLDGIEKHARVLVVIERLDDSVSLP